MLNQALTDPAVVERLRVTGLRPTPGYTPESFARLVREDRAKWQPLVKTLGMQLE